MRRRAAKEPAERAEQIAARFQNRRCLGQRDYLPDDVTEQHRRARISLHGSIPAHERADSGSSRIRT